MPLVNVKQKRGTHQVEENTGTHQVHARNTDHSGRYGKKQKEKCNFGAKATDFGQENCAIHIIRA